MLAKLQQYLAGIDNYSDQQSLGPVLRALADRLSSQTLVSGALAINGAGNAAAKVGAAVYAVANGALVTKAANTVMAALSGTVAQNTFNVYCFYLDSAGNLTTAQGGAGATLAQVAFPNQPQGKAMVGFVLVNPTGGTFTGGTTPLDDGTAVPNAVYVNTLGAVDPSVLLGV